MTDQLSQLQSTLGIVKARAEASGAFGLVELTSDGLRCKAQGCESEAFYCLNEDDGRLWVSFVTPDRWLSESIEADLMHTGDHLEDLLEEELAEFDLMSRPDCQHFRSEDRLFTFRSIVPVAGSMNPDAISDTLFAYLMAYEACFRELGDVSGGGDDL